MKVWIHWEGSHYHLIKNCEAVDEEYNEVDWIFAKNRRYTPCPICHGKELEVREVRNESLD